MVVDPSFEKEPRGALPLLKSGGMCCHAAAVRFRLATLTRNAELSAPGDGFSFLAWLFGLMENVRAQSLVFQPPV
jgi:hypothetical protein